MKRTPLRKRSPKRAAYLASDERQDALAHMQIVKELGCIICGNPADAHHLPDPRSDWRTIPLCPHHHRADRGPEAYHYSRPNFNRRHGSDETLLAKTHQMLGIL